MVELLEARCTWRAKEKSCHIKTVRRRDATVCDGWLENFFKLERGHLVKSPSSSAVNCHHPPVQQVRHCRYRHCSMFRTQSPDVGWSFLSRGLKPRHIITLSCCSSSLPLSSSSLSSAVLVKPRSESGFYINQWTLRVTRWSYVTERTMKKRRGGTNVTHLMNESEPESGSPTAFTSLLIMDRLNRKYQKD